MGGAAAGGSGSTSAGEGGSGGQVDARPGCGVAARIELSNLRLVEGAGPGGSAKLEVDVKNGTADFVSYNPVKFTCTGASVARANDVLVFFGITAGGEATVELQVDFKKGAQAGDVASCTVRGYIAGKTPDDCQSAQTESIEVVVE